MNMNENNPFKIVTHIDGVKIEKKDGKTYCLHPEATMRRSNTGGQCGECGQLFGDWE